MVESNGNYCEEAYLERLIGGQLYEHNENLPRLPIPSLKETIERFIPTALPLCESDEERQTLLEACESFEDDAKHLQLRLQQRREQWSASSWLMLWWNQMGYLQVRDPVAVHVSYFLNINDDPTLPTQEELGMMVQLTVIMPAPPAREYCEAQLQLQQRHKFASASAPVRCHVTRLVPTRSALRDTSICSIPVAFRGQQLIRSVSTIPVGTSIALLQVEAISSL